MLRVVLDHRLLALKAQNTNVVDVENRVWLAIACQESERSLSGFGNALWSWRLATGAVAVAASVGFMAATLTPTAQAKPIQALESWTSSQAPLAPSDLLGG